MVSGIKLAALRGKGAEIHMMNRWLGNNPLALCKRERTRARGFTLLEVMAVVVIVGILAALVIPSSVDVIRQSRVRSAANTFAVTYRMARMRAIGRGAAVLVRYTAGRVEVREAVDSTGFGQSSLASCTARDWNTATAYRIIETYIGDANLNYAYVDGPGPVTGTIDTCFTPAGQAYYRDDPTTALLPLSSRASPFSYVCVWKGAITEAVVNMVLVMPNGIARVVARPNSGAGDACVGS